MLKLALILCSGVSASYTCNFLENNSLGFCESRRDSRNCVKWKIATLYKCKAKKRCTEAFDISNAECFAKSEQAIRDNWASKRIDSQAIGLCFGWQLDVHTSCARRANTMQKKMMKGVTEIQDQSIT